MASAEQVPEWTTQRLRGQIAADTSLSFFFNLIRNRLGLFFFHLVLFTLVGQVGVNFLALFLVSTQATSPSLQCCQHRRRSLPRQLEMFRPSSRAAE